MNREEAIRKAMNEEMRREDFGYRSPIDICVGQWEMTMENEIYKAVQRVDIQVDRDELIKALRYDRDQYNKGYADAVKEHRRPTGHWKMIFHDGNFKWIECSCCGHDIKSFNKLPNFCEECGSENVGG